MRTNLKNNLIYLVLGCLTAIIIYIIAYFLVGNDVMLASPVEVLLSALNLLKTSAFYKALGFTLLRVLIAFIISFAVAVVLAVISYVNPLVKGILAVIVGLLRSLPVLAILLVVLTFISRDFAPVTVCFLSLFPILYSSILTALNGVSNENKEMCKVYKIPYKKQVLKMYIPFVLPQVIVASAGGLSFAIKLIVSAEILASVYGSVGSLIKEASIYSLTAELLALTFVVCMIGVIVEFIGKILSECAEKKLL